MRIASPLLVVASLLLATYRFNGYFGLALPDAARSRPTAIPT